MLEAHFRELRKQEFVIMRTARVGLRIRPCRVPVPRPAPPQDVVPDVVSQTYLLAIPKH